MATMLNSADTNYLKQYATFQNPTADQRNQYMGILAKQDKPQFLNEKEERYFIQTNPNHAYTKERDMRYLGQIDDMMRNNQGVSQAQMNQYNNVATKWNYQTFDPNRDALQKASQPIDYNQFRTQSATIEDLANKYGFDYSREYAKRQAEAEAQALRNANADAQRRNATNKEENLKSIDNNLMDMADNLDRNYFQQYMQQAQNQVNNGLNAGIAADQDLRLAMSRQAEMGGAYRDANLGRMRENNRFTNEDLRLAEALGLIDQQALAREDSLFNDRLNQAFGQIMDLNRFNQSENLSMMDAAFRNQATQMDMSRYLMGFDYQQGRDKVMDGRWQTEFDNSNYWNEIERKQWESVQKWQRLMDDAGLTGMYKGNPTFDRERWMKELEMEQARLALARRSGGGGSGGSNSPSSTKAANSLEKAYEDYQKTLQSQSKSVLDRYYTTPAIQAMEGIKASNPSLGRIIGDPIPPAQNPNLSPWEKMKMLGL